MKRPKRRAFDIKLVTAGKRGKNMAKEINLGIAWSSTPDSYTYVATQLTAEKTGANVVMLDMVKSCDLEYDQEDKLVNAKDEAGVLTSEAARLVKASRWTGSNSEELLKDIDCVIFPGGYDISPTLFKDEQAWHGIEGDLDVSAERDVSDYILVSYCLDHDIPMLGICRGMQMMAVVSGAEMVQDVPTYYEELGVEYNYIHRDKIKKLFIGHPVEVTEGSLIHKIMGENPVQGAPSWHHQMVKDASGTKLTVTGTTDTCGVSIVEVIERSDLKFCLGVQYHPEVPIRMEIKDEHEGDNLMDTESAMKVFNALVGACE